MLAAALAGGVALAGCGSAQLNAIDEVSARYLAAVAGMDPEGVCELLAPATRDMLAQQRRTPCTAALDQLRLPAGTLVSTEQWGDQAQVRTTADTVFLTRTTQGWRVTAAGCTARGDAPYVCAVSGP